MKPRLHRRPWFRKVTLVDLVCLLLAILISSEIMNSGIRAFRSQKIGSRIEESIGAFNRALYLFRASAGDLSDALTPDQVVAKVQATEEDHLTLTIHSILTTGFDPIFRTPDAMRSPPTPPFGIQSRNS